MSARRQSLLRLARFLMPYRARIAAAAIALTVAAACVLALGQGLKLVIDNGFGSGEPRLLDQALVGLIAVAAALATATWFRFYLMMSTGERVVTDLRRAVFDHILGLDPAFFEATRTGEVISRLTNDSAQIQAVIGFGLSMFVRNLLMMAGAAVMLFVTSWKLALFILLGVPLTLIPILLLGARVRRLSRDGQDRVADVSAYVDEAVHEIRTVQAYAHEDADRAAFARHAESAYQVGVDRVRQKAWLISSVMLIAFSAVGVLLWIGGHDVLAGRLTAGELSAFVFYASVVATGAGTVSEIWASCSAPRGPPSGSWSCWRRGPASWDRSRRRSRWRCRAGRRWRWNSTASAFPIPAGRAWRRSTDSRCASRRGKGWPWSGLPARASPRCSRCCCASTTRSRGA